MRNFTGDRFDGLRQFGALRCAACSRSGELSGKPRDSRLQSLDRFCLLCAFDRRVAFQFRDVCVELGNARGELIETGVAFAALGFDLHRLAQRVSRFTRTAVHRLRKTPVSRLAFDPWSGEMREVIGFVRHVAIAIVRGRRQRPILKPPFVRGWLSFCDTAQNAAGQPFSDRKAFAAGGSSRGIPRLGRDTGDVPGKIGLQCHRHGWPQKKAQSQVRAAPLGVKRRSVGPK